ncbi:MAG: Ig-like domain-containing protein [Actinomycetota bacterium]|nr:Ig-like domain-containing protein [Actinomycetota bacterium]
MPNSVPRPRLWSAVALLVGATLALSGCSSSAGKGSPKKSVVTNANGKTTAVTSGAPTTPASSAPAKPTIPVHVALKFSDGSTFGVGIPVIAFFTRQITDARPFSEATKVTVNGTVVRGAWFFEHSSGDRKYPVEAHYRPQNYWPAHAQVHMDLPVKGLDAGGGMSFNDSLTSDFATGAANISIVDASTHTMRVTSDGRPFGSFPVSLGAPDTPTASGVKVIMEKGKSICMSGPGYHECGVKYTQRLTYGGEYLHSAPWNLRNIGHADSSNGCTNLIPADALKLYNFLEIGDVVQYPNANGGKMQLGAGYGDWNVPWTQWQTGGLVRTH